MLSLVLTLFQIGSTVILAPGSRGQLPAPLKEFSSEWEARYLQLNNWDSQHYRDIAHRGYHLPTHDLAAVSSEDVHSDRANVGFFPGYPLLGRWLAQVTGLSVEVALLLVSQLSCLIFWIYFFLLLRRFGLQTRAALSVAFCALAYPTMFYLILGYSESLFLAGLLGMIYWTEAAVAASSEDASEKARQLQAPFWILAGVHGFALTSSRLVGIPLIIYPAVRAILGQGPTGPVALLGSARRSWSRLFQAGTASAIGVAGAGSFFLWCHQEYGIWNLYILLQQKGWQNLPDYLALLKPWSYFPHFFFEDTMDSISRASVPFAALFLLWCVLKDLKGGVARIWQRLPLYGVAFLMFYVSLSGKANANMDSMSRYTLPVYLILLLGWAWARSERSREFAATGGRWRRRGIVGVTLAFALQLYMAYMFLRGHWVA